MGGGGGHLHFESNSDRSGSRFPEAKLGIEKAGWAISNQADICPGRCLSQVLDNGLDNHLAEATALVRRLDSDIDRLEEQCSVSDYAPHAHELVPMKQLGT